MPPASLRLLISLLVVAIATAGAALLVKFCQTANMLLESERQLHAWILTGEVLCDYLELPGVQEWPRSWSDLESVPARSSGMFAWPRDRAALAGLVRIDFALSLRDVARQSADAFTAVHPTGIMLESYRYHYADLIIQRARNTVSRE